MRISDWSSDVCSSDLRQRRDRNRRRNAGTRQADSRLYVNSDIARARKTGRLGESPGNFGSDASTGVALKSWMHGPCKKLHRLANNLAAGQSAGSGAICAPSRSEEHTSELQSLMRTSYAVFCLKKKINII